MAPKSKLPPIPTLLLEALEKAFPDVCPDPSTTPDDVRTKMGEVAVVRFIRRQYDIQNATVLIGH